MWPDHHANAPNSHLLVLAHAGRHFLFGLVSQNDVILLFEEYAEARDGPTQSSGCTTPDCGDNRDN